MRHIKIACRWISMTSNLLNRRENANTGIEKVSRTTIKEIKSCIIQLIDYSSNNLNFTLEMLHVISNDFLYHQIV